MTQSTQMTSICQKTLSRRTLEFFENKYRDYITKDTDNKFIMRCVHPHHIDSSASAMLSKDTGVYHCSVCGSTHISNIVDNPSYDYHIKVIDAHKPKDDAIEWSREEDYYYDFEGNLRFVNRD